ncbi:MAG: hypothetical protein ACREMV_11425 [Gemmatimonadales bacterium]
MKRLALALAIVAMAAACKKADQQGQMAGDTAAAQMADTAKAMADTTHMMAGDTAKRM